MIYNINIAGDVVLLDINGQYVPVGIMKDKRIYWNSKGKGLAPEEKQFVSNMVFRRSVKTKRKSRGKKYE